MGNQHTACCCTTKRERLRLLKKRDRSELEYDELRLRRSRTTGAVGVLTSTSAAVVAVIAATSAPTAGTTVIVAAVFAAGSAVQTGITFYLDEAIMRELTAEISRRSSENRRMQLY